MLATYLDGYGWSLERGTQQAARRRHPDDL